MGIFDTLTGKTEYEKKCKEIEYKQNQYKGYVDNANDMVLKLYGEKRKSLDLINKVESYYKTLQHIDVKYMIDVADSKASIRVFADAVQKEINSQKVSEFDKKGNVRKAVLFGTSAGMAFYTAFGTFAVPTVVGYSVLAFAGPIGLLTIGASAIGLGIMSYNKKIKDMHDKESQLDKEIDRMKLMLSKINNLCKEITHLNESIDSLLNSLKSDCNNDCDNNNIFEQIDIQISKVCRSINKMITY